MLVFSLITMCLLNTSNATIKLNMHKLQASTQRTVDYSAAATQTLLLSAIQACIVQRGSGTNSSTTCTTLVPSRLLCNYAVSNVAQASASFVKVVGPSTFRVSMDTKIRRRVQIIILNFSIMLWDNPGILS